MILPAINDCHIHLRQGELCRAVKGFTEKVCAHVIAMPDFPITDIKRAQEEYAMDACEVHLTCKLLKTTTTREIEEAKKLGVIGYKIYPCGVNPEDGISEAWLKELPGDFMDLLKAINDNELILMHHGEVPSASVLDSEYEYCEIFHQIATRYPQMKNVFEHISTAAGIMEVRNLAEYGCKVFGTITLHHALMTIDDFMGNVHNFCKPILKRSYDREWIIRAMSKTIYGLGSDSAPHWYWAKLAGAAGVFSAPVLAQALYEYFPKEFVSFGSKNSEVFYGFTPSTKTIELVEEPWVVESLVNLVPYLCGRVLKWKLKEV